MRWKDRSLEKFHDKAGRVGNERIVAKFLIFPTIFDDEWRWLEIAKIVQKFCLNHVTNRFYWRDIRWDEQESK